MSAVVSFGFNTEGKQSIFQCCPAMGRTACGWPRMTTRIGNLPIKWNLNYFIIDIYIYFLTFFFRHNTVSYSKQLFFFL